MTGVYIENVEVIKNPSSFLDPFEFKVTFQTFKALKEDMDWKVIYVGSAENKDYDQTLDCVDVGPIPEGKHFFVFKTDETQNPAQIPVGEVVGLTGVMLIGSYKKNEFVRIGYYLNNYYTDPELKKNPPSVPAFEKLQRNILATHARVTYSKIEWDDPVHPDLFW